jgi:hypothetical protein
MLSSTFVKIVSLVLQFHFLQTLLKFKFSEKATKFEKNIPLVLTLQSKRQNKCHIFPNLKETTSQKSHFESFLYGMWQNPIYARRKKAIFHFTYDKKLHSTLLQLAQVQ